MNQRIMHAIGAVLLAVTLFGCGEGSQMSRPKTVEEAVQRTDQFMEAGRQALSPELQFGDGARDDRSRCEDNSGGQVYATRSLELLGADPAKFPEYHSNIRSWWEQNGFRVKSENNKTGWAIGENYDGFTMKLRTNKLGKVYLGVSSPCV